MIKNERQYRITKAEVLRFEEALHELRQAMGGDTVKEALHVAALSSQLDDLKHEVLEYEQLRDQPAGAIEITSLQELPRVLIKARISCGLSQNQLAQRLGLKEQQIQRYEATDYAGANLHRLTEVMQALGLKMRKELLLPSRQLSARAVLQKARDAGLTTEFVRARLVPRRLLRMLDDPGSDKGESYAIQLAAAIGRIYNWTLDSFLAPNPLGFENAILEGTQFKKPGTYSATGSSPYTVYAHYLAMLTLAATAKAAPTFPDNSDPCALHDRIAGASGRLSLNTALAYLWDLGIPVLPLSDEGGFHAAHWRTEGRDVIALKQRSTSHARWLIDLLHELYHVLQDSGKAEQSRIELDDPLEGARAQAGEEQAATDFAVSVALRGRAEELAQQCVRQANGKVEWLRKAAERVAASEDVDIGVLANYLAHRLSLQEINWWPTASLLQPTATRPWTIAREEYLRRVDLTRLAPDDRELLARALEEVQP